MLFGRSMSLNVELKNKNLHLRHLMLFFFRKKKNAAQTAKRICTVYGEGVISARTVCKWFVQFKEGNFDLEDRERTGRPTTVDDKRICELIEENPSYSTQQIAKILQVSHASVKRHLVSMKYKPSRVEKCKPVEKT